MTAAADRPVPVRLRDVAKRLGSVQALDGIDLVLEDGEILALLGPNGAGKTTAISIMLGLRRPDRGTALLFGVDPREPRARRRIGVTPQNLGFAPTLRVDELVRLVGAHFPDRADEDSLLAAWDLTAVRRRQAGGLSGGERRRLGLALAFAGRPRAVFLDEPTTGLDVGSRRRAWAGIAAHRDAGGTALLTTHYLEEAEALATRVVVLHRGRVVAAGAAAEIRARAGLRRIRLAGRLPADLPRGVRLVHENGRATLLTHDVEGVVRFLLGRRVPLDELEILSSSLEEAFLTLTQDG